MARHGDRLKAARARRFAGYLVGAARRKAIWRLLAGIVVCAGLYLGLNAAALGALSVLAGPQAAAQWTGKLAVASTPGSALALLATFVPMMLGALAAARWLHGRGPRCLLGPPGRVLGDAGRGAGVTFAIFLPILGLWALANDSEPNLPPALWLALLPVSLAGIAVQTLAEELVFRGYLLQQLAVRFRRAWVWAGLPALAFAALHFDPTRMGAAAPVAVLAAAAFGLVAADLTARSGSLGLAWGVHLANNAIALVGLATQGTITGLALRVTPYHVSELAAAPGLAVLELLPLLAVWLILRRVAGR